MLLEAPVYKELFGAVEIYEVQKVIKLDTQTRDIGSLTVTNISRDEIYRLLEEMAIVVPMKTKSFSW